MLLAPRSQDTALLCQHVAEHGPAHWQALQGLIAGCPAPQLLSLKWHALLVEHIGSVAKASKAYSDWELCVLFVVGGPPGEGPY